MVETLVTFRFRKGRELSVLWDTNGGNINDLQVPQGQGIVSTL